MSNEDRIKRRAEILRTLKANQDRLAALKAKRQADVHSVDDHALRDATHGDAALVREYLGIGGDPKELPGRFQAPPPKRGARR